ncbi:hypothetical protein [Flavobacterium sp.]|uniref:hypothetical protein n=1 Tax=Flavobacterium sp. TaxID=239 RepID=UPI0039E5ABC7
MKKGTCKLCLTENVELLTKSHIIPQFLFKDMKDINNSFVLIDTNKFVKGRRQHVKFQRDAFHQSDILCEKCDNVLLKKYEDYLKLTFHDTKKSVSRPCFVGKIKDINGLSVLLIENIDYKLYKLGFLSILWRASISDLPFFNNVELGPHEELIRQILFKGNPLDESDYPFITSILNTKNDLHQIILPVTKFKMEKMTHYRFVINGIDLIFMIGSKNIEFNQKLLDFVPNCKSKLKVIMHKDNYGKDMFFSFLKRI